MRQRLSSNYQVNAQQNNGNGIILNSYGDFTVDFVRVFWENSSYRNNLRPVLELVY